MVHAGDGTSVELTLAEVQVLAAPPGWECFAVLFDGPRPALAQWTYGIEHVTMGAFPLFLGPVEEGAAGVRYEAVFNRQGRQSVAD